MLTTGALKTTTEKIANVTKKPRATAVMSSIKGSTTNAMLGATKTRGINDGIDGRTLVEKEWLWSF
jgi:hypothetical protein